MKKIEKPRSVRELIRRKSDGKLFEASYPDSYDEGQAIADCLMGKATFYFREIVPAKKRWWQWKQRWLRTGEIWQPESGKEFEIVDQRNF